MEMNHLNEMVFAELSEEELLKLKEAEDVLNQNREDNKIFLMALTK